MKFDVFVFDIPVEKGKIKKINKSDFWNQTNVVNSGVKSAKGIYIFGIKYGNSYKPYYVGKTNRDFGSEATFSEKLRKYEHCINDVNGSPFIVFIAAKTTKNNGFSKKNNDKLMCWLEDFFILMAYQRNENLINSAKTKFLREVSISGLLHPGLGACNKDSRILKKMLNL